MFVVGEKYNRSKDIHDKFGGNRQGGIASCKTHPYIFLFTGESGENYGYEDGWQNDQDVFLYTGEGQIGDMEFKRGNKAIRDHIKNGKQLLLFYALGKNKPVEYVGEFECSSTGLGDRPDKNGDNRRTIQFNLHPVALEISFDLEEDSTLLEKNILELRSDALKSVTPPETTDWHQSKQIRRKRSNIIKEYVLKRANGICELTNTEAPFFKNNGEPYLEVHHINRLSDGGLDHPSNCAAISPNSHKEIHFGIKGKELDQKLAKLVAQKEFMLDKDLLMD
jgi:5-methylcytosine-specific restriction enzyme A